MDEPRLKAAGETPVNSLDIAYWRRVLDSLARVFEVEKLRLCQLDGAIGDGDHGASMARGFSQANIAFSQTSPDSVATLFQVTGNAFLTSVGGVSGIIFGTLFLEAGKRAQGMAAVTPGILADMLEHALAAIKTRGRVQEGDKSMVDALSPAVVTLKRMADDCAPIEDIMPLLYDAAERGMEATASMAANVGRVRYQKDRGVGHIDSGAASVALIFKVLRDSL